MVGEQIIIMDDWFRDRMACASIRLYEPVRIETKHERHLGPRTERAGVVVDITPSTSFSVDVGFEALGEDIQYVRAAAFGFLDVATANEPQPIRDVQIRFERLIVDPVESSVAAFRLAGRMAARELIKATPGTL